MKEEQLREDQRREALARLAESSAEETLPAPTPREPRSDQPNFEPAEQPKFEPAEQPKFEQPEPQAAQPAPRAEQPKVDSKALLESDGLVMIETDRSKAPAPAATDEAQQLGRPRRERAKPAAPDDDLVQIETSRK